MHERVVQLAVLAFVLTGTVAAAPPAQRHAHRSASSQHHAARPQPPSLPCGNLLAFQVLMDRAGFSSGEIDEHPGPNLQHALAAFQTSHQLPVSGEADCATWQALGGDSAQSVLTTYTITDDDLHAHYRSHIPNDLLAQAKLPDLGYRSMLERLGERFHAAPALLGRINARAKMTAGAAISVPAVEPFDASSTPKARPDAGAVTIVVARDDSSLRVLNSDGSLLLFAPVTTGSEHDPLPIGDWTVKGVQWHPRFHYNPELFWDAKPEDTKATIQPGPNNPVGIVWIALDVEHYGLHGTPAPEQIGRATSHGCVRLTNWDAARVASLVKPGTAVQFR
jgi:lipoprotein-anchoring transpeptidase ErfK/SrfK